MYALCLSVYILSMVKIEFKCLKYISIAWQEYKHREFILDVHDVYVFK